MKRLGAAAFAALVLAACSGGGGTREEAMETLAADAVPRFAALATATGEVSSAVDAACADPTPSTVADAAAAVDAARQRWLETSAVWTGPVMDRRSAGIVDWAVDADGVTELVGGNDAAELTPELIAGSVGADVRGLSSLYGVFTRDDAVELLADARWCAYATSVAATVADEATALESAWTTGVDREPPFSEVVAEDDAAQEWLAMFVDDNVQLVRLLGRPLGDQGDVPSPDPFRDRDVQLAGVADVLASFSELLDDDTEATLAQQFAAASEALRAGDLDLAHERLEEVDKTLSTDVAAQLDVTIGFSDADGDGSG